MKLVSIFFIGIALLAGFGIRKLIQNHIKQQKAATQRSKLGKLHNINEVVLEKGANSLACVICQDKIRNVIFDTCKHMCVCTDCMAMMEEQGKKQCPVCKQPYDQGVPIYIA